jgi:pyrroloquinoline quinone biosynthesis protein B
MDLRPWVMASFVGCNPAGRGALVEPTPGPDCKETVEPQPASAHAETREPVAGARVRVLGIAQDGGLPHAACSCERCEAARRDPRRASPVASLAIIVGARVWLVDASPDLPEQLEALADVRQAPLGGGVDRRPLDGVLLTHAHMGHYLGLAFLGYEAVAATGVDVWASPRMAGFLRTHAPWEQLVRQEGIVVHEATEGRAVVLDREAGIEAVPVAVPHRAEYTDTYAWRISGPRATVLYVPDTDPWAKWTKSLDDVLAGVDLLLVDGTFHSMDELPGRDIGEIGHPLVVDTMDRLQARVSAGELEVWFVHLNHSNPVLDPEGKERRALEARGFRVAGVGDERAL